MSDEFTFDVFLSYSASDLSVVRPLADRLRNDGIKVWFDEWEIKLGDIRSSKIEEGLKHSRLLVLCISANAFGLDWAQLESGTFRFRDPLNKERRFLPLRLDDTVITGSIAHCYYIDWRSDERQQEYKELLDSCRTQPEPTPVATVDLNFVAEQPSKSIQLESTDIKTSAIAFCIDGKHALSGVGDRVIRLFRLESGKCLRKYAGHAAEIKVLLWSKDQRRALSASNDGKVLLWNLESGKHQIVTTHSSGVQSIHWCNDESRILLGTNDCELLLIKIETQDANDPTDTMRIAQSGTALAAKQLRKFDGHTGSIVSLAMTSDETVIISGSSDRTVRIWNVETGRCVRILEGHTGVVKAVMVSPDQRLLLSGAYDQTLRVWNLDTGRCIQILNGHTGLIRCVSWAVNQNYVISGASDKVLRLWDITTGVCIRMFQGLTKSIRGMAVSADGQSLMACGSNGGVRSWTLPKNVSLSVGTMGAYQSSASDQIEYTNAKVLVVGDSNAGKTGLTNRIATNSWKPSEDSTVGAWATQVRIEKPSPETSSDREIWLWDFGGQADQRLIHQLYMDRAALILILFNADNEDVLPGLRDWQTALRRSVAHEIPHFLVAGRVDAGFKASRGKLQDFAAEYGLSYHETSAKTGEGCDELRVAITAGIPWDQMEKRTSPRIFKLIKDEILRLRDEGQVLHTFKELRELLWQRIPDEPRFTDDTLQTVIGLLDGPGVVKELDYGTYILLAPEWINAYAQAVIRTLRSTDNDLGVLPLRSIAEGKLIYQSIGRDGAAVEMRRLPAADERVVLSEMERQLEHRGLCLRQGDKLVFPSHCGRDRPAVEKLPSVFVSYAVKGFLDDIYATLVVKLADCQSFKATELWRDAADFVTLRGDYHMGIKLARDSASEGNIGVYFGAGVTEAEQVIFANYIHAHLQDGCETVQRLRYWVCPKCLTPKGNPEVLMENLLDEGEGAMAECDRSKCRHRFPLWDGLERNFASAIVREKVEQLKGGDVIRLDARRKGKLLALEVGARIASADQKSFEIPGTEDEGIDIELEFTSGGKGTGKRLYLQLKSGNSHLDKRVDGSEVFRIRKPEWIKQWTQQPYPVMLVIGTFAENDDRQFGREKLEFAEVRWMEITGLLKRESQNGTKPVRQIEFKGERLDLSSVMRWRKRILEE